MKKTVLIVGGSSGIGRATAREYLRRGDFVYNASRSPCLDTGVVNFEVNVAYPDTLAEAVAQILKERGKIDVFVYSAGYSAMAPLEFSEESDSRYLFEVNYWGFVAAVKTVLPIMKQQGGGRIVAVSSLGGVLPIPFEHAYSASKAALNAFVRDLNLELRPFNIRVTGVMPGGTKTPFTKKRKTIPPEESGYYGESYARAVKKLARVEQGGMNAARMGRAIAKKAARRRPPIIFAPGLRNKLASAASRLLPYKLQSAFIRTKFGLK